MKLRMAITTLVVAAAALTAGPVAAAEAAPAQGTSEGTVGMTVTGGSASTITFDVHQGARPVRIDGVGVGLTDGASTSEALPTSVDVGNGRTVSGSWSIDDADTITFHFTPNDSAQAGAAREGLSVRSSDWGSDEWGHCVSGQGVAGAAGGGLIGAISGPGAIVSATGGMLAGIISGAITC